MARRVNHEQRLAALRDTYDSLQETIRSLGGDEPERREQLTDAVRRTEAEAREICAFAS
jgi:hypothetical protein